MAFNQPLSGLIEPDTDAWRAASPERRRAFYREAGRRATKRLKKQLLKGIGRSGRLMPARKRPRPDGADGPVMDPHEIDSRTVTLLDFRADPSGVTLYWHNGPPRPDQRLPWSKILGHHAAGRVPGAPVRDVRLSNLNIHHLRREMALWFEGGETFRRIGSATLRTSIPKKPEKFKATGRFDLHNASFGGGGVGGGRELVEKSIEQGTFTGFRQRGRPSRFGPAKTAKPKAPPPVKPPKPKPVVPLVPKTPPAPKPKPAHPGPIKRDHVQEAVRSTHSEASENAALHALVSKHRLPETVTGSFHGMSHDETFHVLEFEGLRWHYAPLPSDPAVAHPIYRQLRNVTNEAPLPTNLAKHTRNIYLTAQANKEDPNWATRYGIPGFVSAATGGDRNVVAYNGKAMDIGTLAHEMGHNLATSVYGQTSPQYWTDPKTKAYYDAMKTGEPPVSEYATKSPAEDFAETVRSYIHHKAWTEKKAPFRTKVIEDLLR